MIALWPRSFRLCVVAFVSVVLTFPATAHAQDAAALVKRGQDLFNQRKYEQAADVLTSAIKADPGSAEAFRLRGEVRFFQEQYSLAVQDYSRAIELNSRLYKAYSARGVARFHLGDLRGTISDETRAIELAPREVSPHLARALAKYRLGDYTGSVSDLSQAIEIEPSAVAYYNRGLTRAKLTDLPGAVADLRKSLELDPKHAYAADARAQLTALEPKLAAPSNGQPSGIQPGGAGSSNGPGGTWYRHPGGGFRLPLPAAVTIYPQNDTPVADTLAWPNLRLAMFCRRDSMAGDNTKVFLRDGYRDVTGRQASTLAAPPALTAMVTEFSPHEKVMYWHLCFAHGGQTYFITVAAPADAPIVTMPDEARRVLDRLEFLR